MKTVIAAALAALCLGAPAGAATYAWESTGGEFAFEFEIDPATDAISFNSYEGDFGHQIEYLTPSLQGDSVHIFGFAAVDVDSAGGPFGWGYFQRDRATFDIFADGSARYVDYREYEPQCYGTDLVTGQPCPDNVHSYDFTTVWSDETLEGRWIDGSPLPVAVPLPAGLPAMAVALYLLSLLGLGQKSGRQGAA